MFIRFVFPIFGWSSVLRLLQLAVHRQIISQTEAKFLQVLSFLPLLVSTNLTLTKPFLAMFLCVCPTLILPIYSWIIRQYDRHLFRQQLVFALDSLLLSLRSGRSFSESLSELSRHESRGLRTRGYGIYFHEICRGVLAQRPTPPASSERLVAEVYAEFRVLEASQHRIVDRLTAFRDTQKLQFKFIRRSRAATRPAKLQSLFMGLLFVLALIWAGKDTSTEEHQPLKLLALTLFLIGTAWTLLLGRKIRWKM